MFSVDFLVAMNLSSALANQSTSFLDNTSLFEKKYSTAKYLPLNNLAGKNMTRQLIKQLIDETPAESWSEQDIHNKTEISDFGNMQYLELKKTFEKLFVDKLVAYPLSHLTGIELFKDVQTVIGCTQYIDNLYQSHPSNFFVFENEFVYHKNLGHNNQIAPQDIPDNGHLLLSVPQAHSCHVPDLLKTVIEIAEKRHCSLHLDMAWWPISKGLSVDLSSPCIKTVATSLSKPFSLSKNRIGIRLSKEHIHDAVSIQNNRNIVPRALLEIGLNYLQQHDLDYMWKEYGELYDHIYKLCRMRPLPIFFMAGEFGKGNVHINKALQYIHNNEK